MIKLKPTSWKILLEILVKANPTKVVEVPIQFESRTAGQSNFNTNQMIAYGKHIAALWAYKNKRLFRFCVVGGTGAVITFGSTWLLTELAGLWYMLSLLIAVAIATVWNYTFNYWWTFATSRNPDSADYDWISFYKGNPIQKWWKQSIANIVWEFIPNGSTLLDIGCGSSPIMSRYPGATGIDSNAKKIEFMRGKLGNKGGGSNQARFAVMDATNIDLPNEWYDYVLCIEVLEHLENSDKVLSEIGRLLKTDGKAVIATPDYSRKWWMLAEKFTPAGKGHVKHYTRETLEAECRQHGLVPIKHKHVAGCDLVELFQKADVKQEQFTEPKLLGIKTGVEVIKRMAKPRMSRANMAVTYLCNQKCKSCNIWKMYAWNGKLKEEMTSDEFVKTIRSNNLMWLSITGGEPFLKDGIGDILSACLNKLRITSIVTNGSKPSVIEESVRKALHAGDNLLTVSVSVEGNEATHDEFVGKEGSWVKATETLDRLSKIKCNRLKLGIEQMITTKLPIGSFEQVKEIAKSLGAEVTYTIEQTAPFYGNTEAIIDKPIMPKVQMSLSPLQLLTDLFLLGANRHNKACVAGEYSCFIDPYGTIYPCLFHTPRYPLTSLRENDYVICNIHDWRVKVIQHNCTGCWTPCETYAAAIFRPWRLV